MHVQVHVHVHAGGRWFARSCFFFLCLALSLPCISRQNAPFLYARAEVERGTIGETRYGTRSRRVGDPLEIRWVPTDMISSSFPCKESGLATV